MTESKSWNRDVTITGLLILMTAYWWYMGIIEAPVDRIQGDVYRIIFVAGVKGIFILLVFFVT